MNAAAGTDRHLSPEGFADYLAAEVPVVLPIVGSPSVAIFIDPVRGQGSDFERRSQATLLSPSVHWRTCIWRL